MPQHCTIDMQRRSSAKVQVRARGHMSEFAICLFVLLFLALFPLVDLLGLAMGAATVCLLAHESVSQASKQESYTKALAAVQEQTESFVSSRFGQLCGLRAVNGYQNCGTDLYVVATKIEGADVVTFGPNTGVTPPIDNASVFEFMCKCTYDVDPWVNLGHIPGLASIPGLGKTARLSYRAYRTPELPTAIESAAALAGSFGRSLAGSSPVKGSLGYWLKQADGSSKFPELEGGLVWQGSWQNQAGGSSPFPETGMGLPVWRDPQLFNQIASAGQTIVAQEVFIVPANSPWVSSGINASAGETVWIDSRADGMWTTSTKPLSPPHPLTDANGNPSLPRFNLVYAGAAQGALVGCQGTLPPWVTASTGSTAPNLFTAGNTLLNFPVVIPGTVSFMINDTVLSDNAGQQIVRIVVTR